MKPQKMCLATILEFFEPQPQMQVCDQNTRILEVLLQSQSFGTFKVNEIGICVYTDLKFQYNLNKMFTNLVAYSIS